MEEHKAYAKRLLYYTNNGAMFVANVGEVALVLKDPHSASVHREESYDLAGALTHFISRECFRTFSMSAILSSTHLHFSDRGYAIHQRAIPDLRFQVKADIASTLHFK